MCHWRCAIVVALRCSMCHWRLRVAALAMLALLLCVSSAISIVLACMLSRCLSARCSSPNLR